MVVRMMMMIGFGKGILMSGYRNYRRLVVIYRLEHRGERHNEDM